MYILATAEEDPWAKSISKGNLENHYRALLENGDTVWTLAPVQWEAFWNESLYTAMNVAVESDETIRIFIPWNALLSAEASLPEEKYSFSASMDCLASFDDACYGSPRSNVERKYSIGKVGRGIDLTTQSELDRLLKEKAQRFCDMLFSLIDASGKSDTEIYRGANVSRQLFSKIRCNDGYCPKKETVLALAISLGLDREATERLLSTLGYALSPSADEDIIISYYLGKGKTDLNEINTALYHYGCRLLGE